MLRLTFWACAAEARATTMTNTERCFTTRIVAPDPWKFNAAAWVRPRKAEFRKVGCRPSPDFPFPRLGREEVNAKTPRTPRESGENEKSYSGAGNDVTAAALVPSLLLHLPWCSWRLGVHPLIQSIRGPANPPAGAR